MKMRFYSLLVVFGTFFTLSSFAQTVTVTADTKTILGTASTANVKMCGRLVDVNGQAVGDAQVPSSGVIVPTTACVTPDGSGHIATTYYANDAIKSQGSLNTTLWSISFLSQGTPVWGATYQFLVADSSENLNSKAPFTTPTPIVSPTPTDSVYMRLDAANSPATGPWVFNANVTAKSINSFLFVDGSVFPTLQSAITSACSSSPVKTVIMPPGSYPLNSTVSWCTGINIVGAGSGQADATTCPTTITTTLSSGDLLYALNENDIHVSNLCISYSGSGANAAIRITSGQRNVFEHVYISGPFARGIQLDSSASATSSTIWNEFRDVHTTGTAAFGVGCLLDSTNATNKVINSNFFYNVRCTGGNIGSGILLTNSGVHNQVINENVFFASEVTAANGSGLAIDTGSTRGLVCIDCNIEGASTGFTKSNSNTVTFIGGNISSNVSNVSDAQPSFTHFIGTNVGGTVQNFAVTPAGDVYVDGLSVGGAAPVGNTVGGTTGWQITASGTAVATINNTGMSLAGTAKSRRIRCGDGSAVVSGDFVLSAGWGSTATKPALAGTDCSGSLSITANGVGIAANPTVAFTFHDGAWPTQPQCMFTRNDASGVAAGSGVPVGGTSSTSAATFGLIATPTAGNTYIITWVCM